ncbi:MAG: trigger factor [Phycisphaerales bacterium]|nr:MAG: trigger factor [Phycisphaerales bacterium]
MNFARPVGAGRCPHTGMERAPMADTTATPEETTSSGNEVKIKEVGPARKRLTITVPADAIDEKLEASLATLMTETALPGFRKGRAPKALMQKRFGSALKTETRNQIVADAYSAAIEENQLKPVGDPEPVTNIEELELKEGQALTFEVDIEVVPDFDMPKLDDIEIKKPKLEISDEMIDREIERQCLQIGQESKVDSDFQPSDRLVGSVKATRKGEDEPFFEHEEALIQVPGKDAKGRGQVLGLLIDGLDKILKGAKVGDTIPVTTTVPETHEREDIRGKEITIEFSIRQGVRVTPASVDEVVERYGMADENMLREQIKLALEQRRDYEQADAMRQQLYEELIKRVDFELPEKLSENQAARILQRYEMELLYRGLAPEEIEERLAESRAQSVEVARNRLKLFFLMSRLAEEKNIQVNEQEVNGRIAMIAAQRGERPEQLRNELTKSGRITEIAIQVRDHKTADKIIQEHAKVSDISADEWQKLRDKKLGTEGDSGSAATGSKKKTTKKKTTSKKKTKKKSTKKD